MWSRLDAVAFGVRNMLYTVRELPAEPLHITVVFNILANASQACPKLLNRFFPGVTGLALARVSRTRIQETAVSCNMTS